MSIRNLALATSIALAPLSFAVAAPAPQPEQGHSVPASWAKDEELIRQFGEAAAFKTFFEELQTALDKDQRMTIARMVAYPFSTSVHGEATTLRNRWQFLEAWDDVMTRPVATAIQNQRYEDLIVTAGGVGFGNGDLWIASVDSEVRIIAVNQLGEPGV